MEVYFGNRRFFLVVQAMSGVATLKRFRVGLAGLKDLDRPHVHRNSSNRTWNISGINSKRIIRTRAFIGLSGGNPPSGTQIYCGVTCCQLSKTKISGITHAAAHTSLIGPSATEGKKGLASLLRARGKD